MVDELPLPWCRGMSQADTVSPVDHFFEIASTYANAFRNEPSEVAFGCSSVRVVKREASTSPLRLNLEDVAAKRPKGALNTNSVRGAWSGTR